MILATKVHGKMGEGPNDQGGSRYHILRACEESLRRLQTDHIDLYQLHRPPLAIPPDETLRAFDDLVRAGKVLYIGCSTHPAWMVMEALAVERAARPGPLRERAAAVQPARSPHRERTGSSVRCARTGDPALVAASRAGSWPAATGRERPPEDSRAARWGDKFTHRLNRTAAEVAGQSPRWPASAA